MTTIPDHLGTISQRAARTKQTIDAARARNWDQIEATKAKLSADITTATTNARTSLSAHMATIRADAEQRRAERDLKRAEHAAESAEQDASDAIDFALWAIDQAEYAVVDAIIARADASAPEGTPS
jgi:hypothetical protein